MSRYVNPSKTSVYFQAFAGDLPLKLATQSRVTAPSGKGWNAESAYAGRAYKGTLITGNQSRVTFNLETRREDISALRNAIQRDELTGDPKPFVITVLESDCNENPDYANFMTGSIFLDCVLTSRSVSAALSDTTTIADPKQMDVIALSAADWIEIRPVAPRTYIPTAFNSSALLTRIAYTPAASTPRGITELTVVGGSLAGNAILYLSYSKGSDQWFVVGLNNLPATLNVTAITILGNRLLIGTTKGIYGADLSQDITNLAWYIANGTTTSDVIVDIHATSPGLIIATTTSANGEYLYSRDQGFSFTRVSNAATARQFNGIAGLSDGLVLIGTLNQRIYRLTSPDKYEALAQLNPDGTALPASADILSIAQPPNRPNELYFGVTDGRLLRSLNIAVGRPTTEEIYYPKAGSPTQTVTDIQFSPEGVAMWFTMTDSLTNLYTGVDYSGGHAGAAAVFPGVNAAIRGTTQLVAHSPIYAIGVASGAFVYIFE